MEQTKKNSLLNNKPLYAILSFSIFFIVGDLFQQLYNVADSIIVGRYVSTSALAAIGVASPVMSLVMFMISGFTIGTGIVLSKWFGKGDEQGLRRTLSTSLIIGLIFTLVITILSMIFCKLFLKFLNTPEDIIDDTANYLYIVFAANIFTYLYNFYCYAIRSIGNSFIPLIFLILSVCINFILDFIFILAFNMGIKGAAFATLISQFLSVIFIITYTNKNIKLLKLCPKDLVFDKSQIKDIFSYSVSVSLQQTFVYIGRIAVQGLVNTFGTNMIAGVNAAEKLNALFQTPFRGYCNASTTFYAQNQGANNYKRIYQGFKSTYVAVLFHGIVFTFIGIYFAVPLTKMFMDASSSQEAISYGAQFIAAMSMNYFGACFIIQKQSFLRGVGYLKSFFLSTVITISCRIIFSYTLNHFIGFKGIFYAVPISWVIGSLFNSICTIICCQKTIKPKINEQLSKSAS